MFLHSLLFKTVILVTDDSRFAIRICRYRLAEHVHHAVLIDVDTQDARNLSLSMLDRLLALDNSEHAKFRMLIEN